MIAACAKAGEWSHALELFVSMQTDQIKADVVAYNALISAFMNGGKPDMVRSFTTSIIFLFPHVRNINLSYFHFRRMTFGTKCVEKMKEI